MENIQCSEIECDECDIEKRIRCKYYSFWYKDKQPKEYVNWVFDNLKTYKDGWGDNEKNKTFDLQLLELIRKDVLKLIETYPIMNSISISPCNGNSIDLHWKNDVFHVLINIDEDDFEYHAYMYDVNVKKNQCEYDKSKLCIDPSSYIHEITSNETVSIENGWKIIKKWINTHLLPYVKNHGGI